MNNADGGGYLGNCPWRLTAAQLQEHKDRTVQVCKHVCGSGGDVYTVVPSEECQLSIPCLVT